MKVVQLQQQSVGNVYGFDHLLQSLQLSLQLCCPVSWFHGYDDFAKPATQYVIVDPQGIPLQVKKSGLQVIKPTQLPATVRMWLDANNPT